MNIWPITAYVHITNQFQVATHIHTLSKFCCKAFLYIYVHVCTLLIDTIQPICQQFLFQLICCVKQPIHQCFPGQNVLMLFFCNTLRNFPLCTYYLYAMYTYVYFGMWLKCGMDWKADTQTDCMSKFLSLKSTLVSL